MNAGELRRPSVKNFFLRSVTKINRKFCDTFLWIRRCKRPQPVKFVIRNKQDQSKKKWKCQHFQSGNNKFIYKMVSHKWEPFERSAQKWCNKNPPCNTYEKRNPNCTTGRHSHSPLSLSYYFPVRPQT